MSQNLTNIRVIRQEIIGGIDKYFDRLEKRLADKAVTRQALPVVLVEEVAPSAPESPPTPEHSDAGVQDPQLLAFFRTLHDQ